MKMIALLVCVAIFVSCSSKEDDTSTQTETSLEIGNYEFDVPAGFRLIEAQGIDSYVGSVEGNGYTISFDFGWYTSSFENLPEDTYEVTVDTLDGDYKQTVKALNPMSGFTGLHMYKVSDSIESPFGYNSLHMIVSGISQEQQEQVLQIFSSAVPVD